MSTGGITLHGGTRDDDSDPIPSPAILLKVTDGLLQDVREASNGQGSLQFIGGKVPKIRLGKRTIDLTISDEAFRHELYSASLDSVHDLHLSGLISHRAELKMPERKASVGSDAALAALQSSLASLKRKKEANSTNITTSVLPAPRNRFDAARKQKQDARRGLLSSQSGLDSSPGSGRGRHGPTQPTSAEEFAARQQAMRTPVIHLLAMGPMSREDISARTHIPKDSLDEILHRVGKQVEGDNWALTERAFKDLDVYKFGYRSSDDRQAAIDNAIRAFDKLRTGKDEKIWQMLLPEGERGKGRTLSKLSLNPMPSPNPNAEVAGDGKLISAANTPRLGPSSTPKIGTKKASTGPSLTKRILANDPKKARAADDAKEKKRKEKETAAVVAAAASDLESRPPARKKAVTKNNNSKIKSVEIIHSSDEESGEEGEVKESKPVTTGKSAAPRAAAAGERKTNTTAPTNSSTKTTTTATTAKAPTKATTATTTAAATATTKSPDLSDAPPRSKSSVSKTGSLSTKPTPASTLRASKPALQRNTPNGASATSAPSKTQLSPQKPLGSKPKNPSPLGAARPRVASDVSERGFVGVQRVRPGAQSPKGLGITNGVRKRQDTVTSSTESVTSTGSEKVKRDVKTATDKNPKSATNGVSHRFSLTNGTVSKAGGSLKRKMESQDTSAAKHRRTESTPSQHSKAHAPASAANGKVASAISSTGKANGEDSNTILHNITYSQGVTLAQRFRDELYPKYLKVYDEQAAKEERGEKVSREEREKLWAMHRRLEEMKMHISAASRREHLED